MSVTSGQGQLHVQRKCKPGGDISVSIVHRHSSSDSVATGTGSPSPIPPLPTKLPGMSIPAGTSLETTRRYNLTNEAVLSEAGLCLLGARFAVLLETGGIDSLSAVSGESEGRVERFGIYFLPSFFYIHFTTVLS